MFPQRQPLTHSVAMLAPLLLGVLCVGLLSTPRQAKATVYAIRLKDGSRIKGTLSMITPLRVVVQREEELLDLLVVHAEVAEPVAHLVHRERAVVVRVDGPGIGVRAGVGVLAIRAAGGQDQQGSQQRER